MAKMATRNVVVCNVLCYLVNKLSKTPEKLLKTILLEFYEVGDLNDAKQQLLDIVNGLETTAARPAVQKHRQGEKRALHIVDDLFTLMTFIDHNKLSDKIPIYVADNPDCLRSTRLEILAIKRLTPRSRKCFLTRIR